LKKWRNYWQVRLSLFVGALNMEIVVIPLILKSWWGLENWNLKIVACVWSTLEILYWYWFAGWLKKELKIRKAKTIKVAVGEAQSIGQDAIEELKEAGILSRCEDWIKQYVIEPFNQENYSNKKLFVFLVGSGYVVGLPLLVFLGALPILWIVGFVFCRFLNWKTGFAAIVVGNLIKNLLFVEGWDFMWRLF